MKYCNVFMLRNVNLSYLVWGISQNTNEHELMNDPIMN